MKKPRMLNKAAAALVAENTALKAKMLERETHFTMPITFQTELHNLRLQVHALIGNLTILSQRIGAVEKRSAPKRRARK